MIIEFFGPPTVGKTTLASALAARLRDRGWAVELVQSYRPAETVASDRSTRGFLRRPAFAPLRRVDRAAREMLMTDWHLLDDAGEGGSVAEALRILRPKSIIWWLRMRQYLLRLTQSWRRSAQSDHIVIYDQGFVQAACSLALLSRTTDMRLIDRALQAMPRAGLLVRLDAPRALLEARLGERERQQSRIERLLEFNQATNLKFVAISEVVTRLLGARGGSITCVDCSGPDTTFGAVCTIEREVAALLAGKAAMSA